MNVNSGKYKLLTKEELATFLSVSCSTIDKWMKKGTITPIKIGRRCLFNEKEIIEAAIKKQRS